MRAVPKRNGLLLGEGAGVWLDGAPRASQTKAVPPLPPSPTLGLSAAAKSQGRIWPGYRLLLQSRPARFWPSPQPTRCGASPASYEPSLCSTPLTPPSSNQCRPHPLSSSVPATRSRGPPHACRALRVRLPSCVRARACAEGWFGCLGISSSPASCASPSSRGVHWSLSGVLAHLLVLSGPPPPSAPHHLLSSHALRGLSALPSPGFHLGAPAARRSIWRNSASTGNPSFTLTLHWIFIIVANNFDSAVLGFDLSEALDLRTTTKPPLRKTGVAKDLRFDQTDSLYEQIKRFKRGSGKPNQNLKSGKCICFLSSLESFVFSNTVYICLLL
ncbi:uncharacterized protein [Petaurus breviceps papuanus]|uniref:uncharacterized protein n=1 Tax=Petaurus breviceps papuanus TaxID=3040969 RepID=UPI0036DE2866